METTKTKEQVLLEFDAEVARLRPDWPADYIADIMPWVLREQHLTTYEKIEIDELEEALQSYLDDLESFQGIKTRFLSAYPQMAPIVDEMEERWRCEPHSLPTVCEWELDASNDNSLADNLGRFMHALSVLKDDIRGRLDFDTRTATSFWEGEISRILKSMID